jgi:hypothetical protein
MTNLKIAQSARAWVGTPFRYQGRIKAVGCDCLGLVMGLAAEMNLLARNDIPITDYDITSYSTDPDTNSMSAKLDELLWPCQKPIAGAVVVLEFAGNPQHLGVVGPEALSLIHSDITHRKVVEHGLNTEYISKIVKIYSLLAI